MPIPPRYSLTPEVLSIIAKIDANRFLVASHKISVTQKNKIQHLSILKSSLFSARIEGNPLTIAEVENTGRQKEKKEVFNILEAIKFIEKNVKPDAKIEKELILVLHKIVMKDLGAAGHFRQETGAIYNSAGVAVYISPLPSKIPGLLENLLRYINSDREKFPLVLAFIAHLIFEKIHPFLDGNGRVGRLLVFAILKARGYDFGLHIPFEEYLDAHKDDYYYFLGVGFKNTNDYLYFMLNAFWEETEKIKKEIEQQEEAGKDLLLPPRQEEIYHIIADHPLIPFDSIHRRFASVPARTIRYDLKKLADRGLIQKIGRTKGVFYKVKK